MRPIDLPEQLFVVAGDDCSVGPEGLATALGGVHVALADLGRARPAGPIVVAVPAHDADTLAALAAANGVQLVHGDGLPDRVVATYPLRFDARWQRAFELHVQVSVRPDGEPRPRQVQGWLADVPWFLLSLPSLPDTWLNAVIASPEARPLLDMIRQYQGDRRSRIVTSCVENPAYYAAVIAARRDVTERLATALAGAPGRPVRVDHEGTPVTLTVDLTPYRRDFRAPEPEPESLIVAVGDRRAIRRVERKPNETWRKRFAVEWLGGQMRQTDVEPEHPVRIRLLFGAVEVPIDVARQHRDDIIALLEQRGCLVLRHDGRQS